MPDTSAVSTKSKRHSLVKVDVQLVLCLFYFIAMGTVITVHGLRHIRIFSLM